MSKRYETFSYTPVELAESMTGTVQDTLVYLYNHDYIDESAYDYLASTLAVYAMPNRKGFGQRLRERFFGTEENEDAFVFPIIEIGSEYHASPDGSKGKSKPKLNVIKGKFDKEKTDE